MNSYFQCRGRVFQVQIDGQNKSGFLALEPPIKSSADSPVLLISDDSKESAAVTPQAAMDDSRILYIHGRQFTPFTINGVVLLGSGEVGEGNGYKAVNEWFESNVVTANKTPVNLSLPGKVGVKIHITDLAWGTTDTNYHIKPFSISGLKANPVNRE